MSAEGLTFTAVGGGQVQGSLGGPHGHPDEHHPLLLEVAHRLVEAAVLGTQKLVVVDPDVVERQLGSVGAEPAVLVQLGGHGEAGGVGGHQEHGDAVALVGVGPGGHDDEVAVDGIGDEGLASVDAPAVPVAHRCGSQAGNVGSGVGLCHPDRQDRLASQDRRQPALELFRRARVEEVGQRHVGVDQHRGLEAAVGGGAECLGEGGRGEHSEAEAPEFLRNPEPEHAEGAHLA